MIKRSILVTGAAGFIGFHVCQRLLADGWVVTGVDNLNPYYDPALKRQRFSILSRNSEFIGRIDDLSDADRCKDIFISTEPSTVVHLAAQPGVRLGLTHASSYISPNITSFLNILECCRHQSVAHLVFASSSSVYGNRNRLPFSEDQSVGHPLSLYAATKRANELMAHAYSHSFGLPTSALRLFSVYGPWGRPDMAIYRFTERIAQDLPLTLAGDGSISRDFTYIDDVVEAISRVIPRPPNVVQKPKTGVSYITPDVIPFRILNIGGNCSSTLSNVINIIEKELNRTATYIIEDVPAGDIFKTLADNTLLANEFGYVPSTNLDDGLHKFVKWYLEYVRIK